MARHHPLTCKEVKCVLKVLGFSPTPGKRTSHEQWIKEEKGRFRQVTVDCPKSPFSQDLVKWMAKQAGVSKNKFYSLLGSC